MLDFNDNIISNYDLFKEIDVTKEYDLLPNTTKYSVGVCGSSGKYYCYYVNYKGTVIYSEVFNNFSEALETARNIFYKKDCERYARLKRNWHHFGYYTLYNDALFDEGYINYLKKYDLCNELSNPGIISTIGLCNSDYYDEFFIYFNSNNMNSETCQSVPFDIALNFARDCYLSRLKKDYGRKL